MTSATELVVIVVAVMAAVLGLCEVFFKDAVWILYQHSERRMGAEPVRTPQWDKQTEFAGWSAVMLGVGLLLVILISHLS
ncbi:MAG: hypothetical protein U0694_15655 [Anaerolineae bacterium]